MTTEKTVPKRQIRAVYDDATIRVYQAYSHPIADAALAHQTFVSPPFSMSRMTWVKPSFLWMMYRSGWGEKDDGQRRILAIDIDRAGFEWALENSCASHPEPGMPADAWGAKKARCPVRIQWDPERDLRLNPLDHRSLQMGIGGDAVKRYVNEWIRRITDITTDAQAIKALVDTGDLAAAAALLPAERPYTPASYDMED
ncbi:DUF4291 domain-containing protein [Bacillus sp. NP157]|nr:DUF4291 domain-containing protein [Bacillus sp. NP157]